MSDNTDILPDGTSIPELKTVLQNVAEKAMQGLPVEGWTFLGASFHDDYSYSDEDLPTTVYSGEVTVDKSKERPEVAHVRFESKGKIANGEKIRFTADVKKNSVKICSIDASGKQDYIY